MMNIKPIRSAADHADALARIESLWDAEPGTKDGDTLEVLATLVDAYERSHIPIGSADPIEAIKFRLEQQGDTRRALEGIIGSRARVSEVLLGRRPLSLNMIRALHDKLQIPLETLIVLAPSPKPAKKAASPKSSARRAKEHRAKHA